MKYLKKFNESDMVYQIWNQFMDTIKECFIEFEDNGWYWSSGSEHPKSSKRFSLDWPPHFNCIMLSQKEYDKLVSSPQSSAQNRKEYIDWTGRITSDGEVIWDTKDLIDKKFVDITEGNILEEAENFLVAVKRIQQETGNEFYFSYNNRGGDLKIIIQGRV